MARLSLKLALLAVVCVSLSGCLIYSGDSCDDLTRHHDDRPVNETPAPVASTTAS